MHEGDFLVDRYRLVRKLGHGAMGQVWLAFDSLLTRHVAVKRLFVGSSGTPDEEALQRVRREARLAAQLNHPHAVQVYDMFTAEAMPYVVMEYVEGETLANRIEAQGHLAPRAVRSIMRQVAAGLAAAHAIGIVHRDVKPANILLTSAGVAKLADFGIARGSTDPNLTGSGLVIGTLAYMAPEVAAGDPATPASDVWSLGAAAYAATEGRAPFAGENSARMLYRKCSEPVPAPLRAGELTELVGAMMAAEPADRPTGSRVATALEGTDRPTRDAAAGPTAIRTTPMPTASPEPPTVHRSAPPVYPSPVPVASEPARKRGLPVAMIAAAVVLVALVAGGLVLVVGGSGDDTAVADPATSSTAAATPVAATPSSATSAPPVTMTVTAPAAAATTAPAAEPNVVTSQLRRYTGPDGLSADGPASWNNSCADAKGTYYRCAGPEGFLGGYFRLRLKSDSASSLTAEVRSEVRDFQSRYSDANLAETPVEGWSVSDEATDLTYAFTNSQGAARRGIERIFVVDGSSYIIATTDRSSNWANTQRVFRQLVDSASF